MDGLYGAGVSVSGTKEYVSDPFPRDIDVYFGCNPLGLKGTAWVCLLAHRSAIGSRVTTSYGARHMSERQVPVFLGAEVSAQATWVRYRASKGAINSFIVAIAITGSAADTDADEVADEEGSDDAPLYPELRSENGDRPEIYSVSDSGFSVLDHHGSASMSSVPGR